ncbi:hypothetical protein AVDCRST_MAG92-1206 [uncultured Coleofasciculus sp.]|uniref:Uncharacterized protein n=1 Tax=uncultured Coleofasciculus sp. TaxID=1267456 RepID=A0A6J4HVJ3_9CYAN|nr:hypothetical protein AVDCRST_MAG92-1206 [uncultured Coleofasciculus sp.]
MVVSLSVLAFPLLKVKKYLFCLPYAHRYTLYKPKGIIAQCKPLGRSFYTDFLQIND